MQSKISIVNNTLIPVFLNSMKIFENIVKCCFFIIILSKLIKCDVLK